MAKFELDGLDFIVDYLDSRLDTYSKWFSDVAGEDLYDAYIKVADKIKPGEIGIHTAAKKVDGGIEISGANSLKKKYKNRWDPSKPAVSKWSGSLYGEPIPQNWKYRSRVGGKSKTYHFTHVLQITINNILDLVWDKGYVALPESSISITGGSNNPHIWKNPKGKWMRNINVQLGTKQYSGSSAKTILEDYAKDLENNVNDGEKLPDVWNKITDDLSKAFSQ